MLCFENNGVRIDMKSFLEGIFFEAFSFFGQVWEKPGKIPSHSQKCTCSYTNVSKNTRIQDIAMLEKQFYNA